MIKELIKNKAEEISILEGNDKLEYLIDLAKDAKPLEEKFKVNDNKIFGCASNLWVIGNLTQDKKINYKFDADSFITRGTAKLVIDILNNQNAKEISELVKEDFKPLGIMELLTAQRQNGLGNLLDYIIKIAKSK